MFPFSPRKVAPDVQLQLTRLDAELSKLQSVVRQLETEQATMHDQVRKWMRRAVAAERAVEKAQDEIHSADTEVTPETPLQLTQKPRTLWGARARIAARRAAAAAAGEDQANGVHS